MYADSLKKIWITAAVLIGAAAFCLYAVNQRLLSGLRGNQVFAVSEDIRKVQLSASGKNITLTDDDGLWRVVEADNYYADFNKIHTLLENIRTAKTGRQVEPKTEPQWTEVQIFGADNKLLGTAQIGGSTRGGMNYVRYQPQNETYFSGWKMQLSDNVMSWTYQPLLKFEGLDIARLQKGRQAIVRIEEGSAFYDLETKMPYRRYEYLQIFDILSHLQYERVLSSQEFDNGRYPSASSITLTTFDGQITTLRLYTDYHEYWLQIELGVTRLPKTWVVKDVEEKRFLYEDWWFKLSSEDGRTLFMFNL